MWFKIYVQKKETKTVSKGIPTDSVLYFIFRHVK